jgi:dihydrofolate reductase
MRRLIVTVYSSLDGVIEGEGNAALETWQLPFADDEFERRAQQQLDACDALLLGRKTYQGFAEAWPSVTDEHGIAERMNSLPKYVASTTLTEPLGWNATLLKGDVPKAVAELAKQDGGTILMYGCGDLAYTLTRLRLVGTSTMGSGIVVLTYQEPQGSAQG